MPYGKQRKNVPHNMYLTTKGTNQGILCICLCLSDLYIHIQVYIITGSFGGCPFGDTPSHVCKSEDSLWSLTIDDGLNNFFLSISRYKQLTSPL